MKLELSRHRGVIASIAMLGCLLAVSGCEADPTSETTDGVETSRPDEQDAKNVKSGQAEPIAKTGEAGDSSKLPKNPEPSVNATTPEGESAASTAEARQTPEGWWRILFSTPSSADGLVHDVSAGFLKIGKTGEGYVIEETRLNNIIKPAELTRKSSVTKSGTRLFFQHQDLQFDYAGALAKDGVIRGNLQFDGPRQNVVRLAPVTEESVPDELTSGEDIGPTSHAEEIRDALEADDPVAALQGGQSQWTGSPALYFAYLDLLERAGELQLDEQATQGVVDAFLNEAEAWGERAVQYGRILAGITLMSHGEHLSLGQRLIEQAREQAPELTKHWDAEIAYVEQLATIESAWTKADSGDKQGLETLRELSQAGGMPTQHLTYRLAQAERTVGSAEQAERLFAKLAVLPWSSMGLAMLAQKDDFEPPGDVLATMHEERTGSREGLAEFLETVYHEEVTAFVPDEEKNRAAAESERVVLLELFTGATCPPCVAADVGTEAIEKSYPRDDVVVLRYHLHIPGPDPLATTVTEQRQEYYSSEILGTPTLLVNGTKPIFNIGGPYEGSEMVYGAVSGMLSEMVTEPAAATLELAATVEGENLHIVANGSGGEKPFDAVKLRIVIAENEIGFAAPNGIMQHSMVVRGMPGGAEGIGSEKGSFAFDETVSLIELRKDIHSYLDSFEQAVGQPFQTRPGDLGQLSVVAFLQDDVTHEILQAALVPIEEQITLPPPNAPEDEIKEEAEAPEPTADADGGPALEAPGDGE